MTTGWKGVKSWRKGQPCLESHSTYGDGCAWDCCSNHPSPTLEAGDAIPGTGSLAAGDIRRKLPMSILCRREVPSMTSPSSPAVRLTPGFFPSANLPAVAGVAARSVAETQLRPDALS